MAAPPTVPRIPPPEITAPATPPTPAPVVALFCREDMLSQEAQPAKEAINAHANTPLVHLFCIINSLKLYFNKIAQLIVSNNKIGCFFVSYSRLFNGSKTKGVRPSHPLFLSIKRLTLCLKTSATACSEYGAAELPARPGDGACPLRTLGSCRQKTRRENPPRRPRYASQYDRGTSDRD